MPQQSGLQTSSLEKLYYTCRAKLTSSEYIFFSSLSHNALGRYTIHTLRISAFNLVVGCHFTDALTIPVTGTQVLHRNVPSLLQNLLQHTLCETKYLPSMLT